MQQKTQNTLCIVYSIQLRNNNGFYLFLCGILPVFGDFIQLLGAWLVLEFKLYKKPAIVTFLFTLKQSQCIFIGRQYCGQGLEKESAGRAIWEMPDVGVSI